MACGQEGVLEHFVSSSSPSFQLSQQLSPKLHNVLQTSCMLYLHGLRTRIYHGKPQIFRKPEYLIMFIGQYGQPEQVIQCDSINCIFSPNHPKTCAGASCKRTCWQYRQPSEQFCER
ncbi:hypothetical protein BDY19DRAFT_943150 [Irpex rosettiformis]|uniref:Uncharacterized protein n=1 Tax=Irpex rosettiformis TaxID=378272 RepID=A0ACB8U5P7_9APHY|nr:hypothetical protein BDY19DRAFT_943150 [Irpex rosettiformis]